MNPNNHGYNLVALNDLRNRLGAQVTSTVSSKKLEKIIPNIGVDEIVLNQTVAKKIVEKYGSGYDFYDINGYSLEMKYFLQDFSCFFLQHDQDMKIHVVRIWKSCKAFKKHSDEISSGFGDVMSLHDVFTFYRMEAGSIESYDGTCYVDFGFFQYHFFTEGAPYEYIPIESVTIKARNK